MAEENFCTVPLDDQEWSEEPIPVRELCIQMALDKSETSHSSQIPTPLQETFSKPIPQEEPMDNTDSDMPNLINVPEEVLFQDYLSPPWIWTYSNVAN